MKQYLSIFRLAYQRGFFHFLSSNFFTQIVAFGSQFLVAWILAPEDMGRIRILQTYTSIGIIFAGLGFNTSILKLCSELRSDYEKVVLFRSAFRYTLVPIVAICLILLVLNYLGLLTADKALESLFPFYILTIIPLTLNSLFIAYLQALKRIKKISEIQLYTKLIAVALILSGTYLFYLYGFIAGTLIGLGLTTYFLFRFTRKINGEAPSEIVKIDAFREHWRFAKFAFLANGVNRLGTFADVFLINYLIYDRVEVGYYSFALTMILGYQLIESTAQQFATPFLSSIAHDRLKFIREFKKVYAIMFAVSCVILVPTFTVVSPLIDFVFAGKYNDSMPYFYLLVIGWFFKSIASLKGAGFLVLNKINVNFTVVAIATPLTFVFAYFSIVYYGVAGAAYGVLFNRIFIYLLTSILFKKELRIA